MNFSLENIIKEELIDSFVKADNCSMLFSYVSDILYTKGYVKEDYGKQLEIREKAFPTGLATKTVDVAIPHTDAVFVKKPFIFVLKPQSKISFHQMGTFPKDNVIVYPKLIFVLGFDKSDMQLTLLQTLMNMFNDEIGMKKLMNNTPELNLFEELKKQIEIKGEQLV